MRAAAAMATSVAGRGGVLVEAGPLKHEKAFRPKRREPYFTNKAHPEPIFVCGVDSVGLRACRWGAESAEMQNLSVAIILARLALESESLPVARAAYQWTRAGLRGVITFQMICVGGKL